jgi:hypothetical protein
MHSSKRVLRPTPASKSVLSSCIINLILQVAAKELLALLAKPSLDGIPLLVLGNKNDLPGALGTQQLIQQLELQVRGKTTGGGGCQARLSSRVATQQQLQGQTGRDAGGLRWGDGWQHVVGCQAVVRVQDTCGSVWL